jgi:NusA-like KH domain protein
VREMKKMKLTMKEILLMNALTQISEVSAKDCIVDDNIVSFLVAGNEVGKAIGKKAMNVKELETKLKKRIEIIGFFQKPEMVLESTFEIKSTSVKEDPPKQSLGGVAKQNVLQRKEKVVVNVNATDKKKVLGNFARFKRVKEFIKRNYGVELILI